MRSESDDRSPATENRLEGNAFDHGPRLGINRQSRRRGEGCCAVALAGRCGSGLDVEVIRTTMVFTSILLIVPDGVMSCPAAPVAAESDRIEVVLVCVRPEPETTVFTTKTVFAPGRIAPKSPVRLAVHLVAGVAVSRPRSVLKRAWRPCCRFPEQPRNTSHPGRSCVPHTVTGTRNWRQNRSLCGGMGQKYQTCAADRANRT